MKTLPTLLFFLFASPLPAADWWLNHKTGAMLTPSEYDDMKSLGEHRDAESLDASRAILEQAKMEGGKIVLKQWGKGKFWVGRQIEGGGFQGPYLASGYYTSRVTVTYHDFSNRRG